MQPRDHKSILSIMDLVDPADIIPVIERGVELEKLELSLEPDSLERKRRIRSSRVVLALLYSSKLGIDRKQPG